ncbi:MAG: sigma-70 family RNA polymerase sigma factor [Myxococcales bacterium]|nr:sigma-70 family RNA polymerase sigma factor [Myxococcales bacterium]
MLVLTCKAMGDAIRRAYDEAARVWPALEARYETFAALAQRAGDPELAQRHGADLYLASALEGGDPRAAAAFEAHCGVAIEASMSRLGLPRWQVEDLRQQLVAQLVTPVAGERSGIVAYSGRGSLRGWVGVVAWRFAVKRVQRARRTVAVGDDLLADLLEPARGDAELDHLKRVYRAEFAKAFREALQALTPRERNLIRQRYLDGVEVGALARIYQTHRVTVSRWISSARETVARETKEILARQLDISPSECESVMRLVNTHFDVSMSILKTDA